jgi:hypothetical protein
MKSNLVTNVTTKPRPMEPVLLIQKHSKKYVILTVPSLYFTDASTIAGVVVWNDGSEECLRKNKIGDYSHTWVWNSFEVLESSKSLALQND